MDPYSQSPFWIYYALWQKDAEKVALESGVLLFTAFRICYLTTTLRHSILNVRSRQQTDVEK